MPNLAEALALFTLISCCSVRTKVGVSASGTMLPAPTRLAAKAAPLSNGATSFTSPRNLSAEIRRMGVAPIAWAN